MKKYFIALALMLGISSAATAQLNLGNILGGSGSGNSSLGDIVNSVTSVIGDNSVEISQITGTWKYKSPAVTFNSDNFLQKAGGAAASATIESKLSPYFSKAGLTALTITFNSDDTFTAKAGKMSCNGTVTKNSDGSFTFKFSSFGKIPAGSLVGYVQKKGSNITVTFDASKLMSLMSKVASLSGNSTLKSASSLLNSYDGMNIGCEMTKQ